jgi:GNAT superfamily N-acetyltransferase
MDIVEVDPFDEPLVADWHATVIAAEEHDRGDARTSWTLPETLVAIQGDQSDRGRTLFAGVEDGAVVVSGQCEVSYIDNLDHAWLRIYTRPEHRRRGHGSAMLAHLEEVARANGRLLLDTEADWLYSQPGDGSGVEVVQFLLRRGFRLGLGDVHRVLDLPVDVGLLDALAAEAAPHHPAYTLRTWVGPVPEDIVQSFAELVATLVVEAPTGDLEREPESADVGALRRSEELLEKQGRTTYNAAALNVAGEVVAYSNLATVVHDRDNAYQWGTLVRRSDRGHRLGMAVKAATLRRLHEDGVLPRRLHTWNAEVNSHMIGINERLGFRPVERSGEFQKSLA